MCMIQSATVLGFTLGNKRTISCLIIWVKSIIDGQLLHGHGGDRE